MPKMFAMLDKTYQDYEKQSTYQNEHHSVLLFQIGAKKFSRGLRTLECILYSSSWIKK